MVVRVYFPEIGKQPVDHSKVSIAVGRETRTYTEGSVTIQGYGVAVQTQKDGTYILPWASVTQVHLEK